MGKIPALEMKIELLGANSKVPTKAHDTDACFDLYSSKYTRIVSAGGREWVPCGIKIKLPEGYFARIYGRSGFSYEQKVLVGAGVIDEDYVGEWRVLVYNFSPEPLMIPAGTRIAQFALHRRWDATFVTVPDLENTVRGEKGFGSSGNN